jgi:hypothetical protein
VHTGINAGGGGEEDSRLHHDKESRDSPALVRGTKCAMVSDGWMGVVAGTTALECMWSGVGRSCAGALGWKAGAGAVSQSHPVVMHHT